MESKEILELNLNEFRALDCAAIRIASPGAQGDPNSILIVTTQKTLLHGKGEDDLMDLKDLLWKERKILGISVKTPVKPRPTLDLFNGKGNPVDYFYSLVKGNSKWNEEYLGGGNSLFLRANLADRFYNELDRQCELHNTTREQVFLYDVWLEVVMEIL